MNEINVYIGGQIRKYRKANGMTLQQLADVIHKSRATVCKYENGEISIDIATLYEISQALQDSRARGAARHLCGELYALLGFWQRMQQ